MQEQLNEVSENLKEILSALKGSDLTGKGLVRELEDTKKRVDILERWKISVVSGALAAGVICGWLISRAWEFIKG